jgi:hypothetical protein
MLEQVPPQQTPQQTYNAAMDSVKLINTGNVAGLSDTDWADIVKRNKEHLQIQVNKGVEYFGDLDLTPFTEAIKTKLGV